MSGSPGRLSRKRWLATKTQLRDPGFEFRKQRSFVNYRVHQSQRSWTKCSARDADYFAAMGLRYQTVTLFLPLSGPPRLLAPDVGIPGRSVVAARPTPPDLLRHAARSGLCPTGPPVAAGQRLLGRNVLRTGRRHSGPGQPGPPQRRRRDGDGGRRAGSAVTRLLPSRGDDRTLGAPGCNHSHRSEATRSPHYRGRGDLASSPGDNQTSRTFVPVQRDAGTSETERAAQTRVDSLQFGQMPN